MMPTMTAFFYAFDDNGVAVRHDPRPTLDVAAPRASPGGARRLISAERLLRPS
jgi:hypothetical protein